MIPTSIRLRLIRLSLCGVLLFLAPGRLALREPIEKPWMPHAAMYYVAPDGDDANAGTAAQPWRTIQKAANTLLVGDTVYIRAGTYHERVTPQNSGSAAGLITYAAYPGEVVTLDGSGITLPNDLAGLFDISNKSYIQVSGLHVINAGPYNDNAGLLVLNSSFITVTNNSTYNTRSSGIGVWGSDHVVVASNRVDEAGGSGWQECISVAGTDTFEVRDNEVLNCHKEGICIKDGDANGQVYGNRVHDIQAVGIYVDAWDQHTHHIEVYQNIAHDVLNNDGFALASEMGGLLEDIHVYNNLAYHNRYVGLAVTINGDAITHPMQSLTIINNTFYNNGWATWGGGITIDNPNAQDVTVRNNLVSQNLYSQLAVATNMPTPTLAIDHNLIDAFRRTEGEVYGDGYSEGDPTFVNVAGADFHLQASSPAIDAGSAVGAPSNDFDGRVRPLDGNSDGVTAYDIGAFETPFYSERMCLPIVWRGP